MFLFSPKKNSKLKAERSISFEEIIAAIEDGYLLDVLEHPNREKYGHQKMYVVCAKEYIYLIPFVENKEGDIFLKTIIPSRKAKQAYNNERKK
jgi:hypothetical protein